MRNDMTLAPNYISLYFTQHTHVGIPMQQLLFSLYYLRSGGRDVNIAAGIHRKTA